MEKILKKLQKYRNHYNFYLMLQYSDSLKKDIVRPEKPAKPYLKNKYNREEVLEYAEKLEKYDSLNKNFKEEKQKYDSSIRDVNDAIEEIIKLETGFYDYVPNEKQSKVWWKAWNDGYSDGYSDGYYSVHQHLDELVNLFVD